MAKMKIFNIIPGPYIAKKEMMNESNYIRDGRENSSIPRYLH
jgi:hypothetical protein